MLSTYVHMLLCLRAECTQCSPDSKQYKRVLGSALFQFALILVFRVPHTCVADSDAQGFARWLTCQAVFAKRKKSTRTWRRARLCLQRQRKHPHREAKCSRSRGSHVGLSHVGLSWVHVDPCWTIFGPSWAVLKPSCIMLVCLGTI
jgi:hypothetical protein